MMSFVEETVVHFICCLMSNAVATLTLRLSTKVLIFNLGCRHV